MDEVDESIIAPKHRGDGLVKAAEHNILAKQQPLFMFFADAADKDSADCDCTVMSVK